MVDAAMRIAITGSSGLIGSALSEALSAAGHDVVKVVRDDSSPRDGDVSWNPVTGTIDTGSLEGVDAVVHLAGATIGRRWTATRKREILRSREEGTGLLATAIGSLERRPHVLVSVSAVGVYGSRGDEILTESSTTGDDFLARVCGVWEGATRPAADAGIRVVNLRLGVVLEAVLPRLLLPFRLGLGGRLGNGKQWFSWITLDDVVAAIIEALSNERLVGPVNATSPAPVTNAEFTKVLGRTLHRPTILPLPSIVISALFGEMGRGTLLASQRVLPETLTGMGFDFSYPELGGALRHVLGPE
jgi:uncharacterized protein